MIKLWTDKELGRQTQVEKKNNIKARQTKTALNMGTCFISFQQICANTTDSFSRKGGAGGTVVNTTAHA